MTKDLALPKRTRSLVKKHGKDNGYLNYYRYYRKETKGNKNLLPSHRISKEALKLQMENVRKALKECEHYVGFSIKMNKFSIGSSNYITKSKLSTVLHPLYGIPYIPSSAIKGLLRYVWIQENCHKKVKELKKEKKYDEKKYETLIIKSLHTKKKQEYIDWFGIGSEHDDSQRGKLIFFDGLLACGRHLGDEDLMTPNDRNLHNKVGKKGPTNDQGNKNTKPFHVFIGSLVKDEEFWNRTIEPLTALVTKAFEDYGIGYKARKNHGKGTVHRL